MKTVLVRQKHPAGREDLQLPEMRCRWRPAWRGTGTVPKGRVRVRPQQVAVHPSRPSTRLEMRLLEARQRVWHLAGAWRRLWSRIPEGQCGTSKGFDLRLVWLTLQRTPPLPFWLLGRSPQEPHLDRLGEARVGRCFSEVLFYASFSTPPLLQDYIIPEISLYSEEGLKGEQVRLTKALEDPQGLEKPLQVASAIVSAGL